MKHISIVAMLCVAACALSATAGKANHVTHPELAAAITNQAQAVRNDAAIYQKIGQAHLSP
jgi:hypothetical protein